MKWTKELNVCALSSLYLLSFMLKLVMSKDISPYLSCVAMLRNSFKLEEACYTCAELHNVACLQNFMNDFAKSIVVMNILYCNVLERDICIYYWCTAHLSVLVFTYISSFDMFCFSFDSATRYDFKKVLIGATCLLTVGSLMVWNITTKKLIAKRHLLAFAGYYVLSLALCMSATKDVTYHLHHSFVCTFVGYFCNDWCCRLNKFGHSILLGITMQGLVFYQYGEYDVFIISKQIIVGVAQIYMIHSIVIACALYILYDRSKIIVADQRSDTEEQLLLGPTNLHTIVEE